MNILATQYSLKDRAYDIFLAGCRGPHCPGCHNPEGWEFGKGKPFDPIWLYEDIRSKAAMVHRVRLMGGEPLDQNLSDLHMMLHTLWSRFSEMELWLFTKYTPNQFTERQWRLIRNYVDYIKCGRYEVGNPGYRNNHHHIDLASGNQFICSVFDLTRRDSPDWIEPSFPRERGGTAGADSQRRDQHGNSKGE